MKKPDLLNNYIIISPSIWWDNGSLLNEPSTILEKSFLQKTEVYIGVGKEGLTPTAIPRVMEVDANLLAERIRTSESEKVTVHFDYLPQENHATASHQALSNAIRMIYTDSKE